MATPQHNMRPQVTVQDLQQASRTMRRPQHPFQIRSRPYQIAPFFFAPVLPGETLDHLLMQSRCVSDPIVNPLIGWWGEYYFFYVKHRDLAGRDDFTSMMLDPSTSLAAYNAAASPATYHGSVTIDWVDLCTREIVEWYFRDEDEDASTATLGSFYQAAASAPGWMDSSILDANVATQDINVDLDANATITVSEVERAMEQWRLLRENGLTELTYEDYLAGFGIRRPTIEDHKPELLRFSRNWTYPSNTVNPADGTPTSALSWSISERADKRRFFKEPGFLIGLYVARPKVYFSKQLGGAHDLLTDLYRWLPAQLNDDPRTSMVKLAAAAAPLTNQAAGYWVDLRDLFMYGDQFVNFDLADTTAGLVALPTAGLLKRYVATADIDALFVNAAGGKNLIRQDGIVSLAIKTRTVDMSPTT